MWRLGIVGLTERCQMSELSQETHMTVPLFTRKNIGSSTLIREATIIDCAKTMVHATN